jgi:hypothetical protein
LVYCPKDIWKKNINKMKSCTQVWKTRNLTIKGKTLIVKNFVLAQMGFETEIRGIPEKYKKELKCFYRISVTSDYLSHSMSPSHC